MVEFEVTAGIAATGQRVWTLLADVESWPHWLPTVTLVEALDGGPLAIGRRYRVEQPKLRPTVWTVTELQPGTHFQWQARSPGMTMVADHAVTSLDGQAVQVRLRFRFEGVLGALLGRMFARTTRHYLQAEAQALKRQAEAS